MPNRKPKGVAAIDKLLHKRWYQRSATRWGFGVGLALVTLVFTIATLIGDPGVRVDRSRLTIAEVRRDVFRPSLSLTATAVPERTIYLDAVEGGRIEAVFVESGIEVKRGDTLLQLSNPSLQLDIINREAQLFEQRNNLRNSRLELERNALALRSELLDVEHQLSDAQREYELQREMYERRQVSEHSYATARDRYEYFRKRHQLALESVTQDSVFRQLQVAALEESVEHLGNNLAIVRRNLDNLTVQSPATGLLTALNAEIGESKSPGERIGQIDIVDRFKLSAEVDEFYLTRVEPDLKAEFEISGRKYSVRLSKVYPEVSDGRFRVEFALADEASALVRRGQTIPLRLVLGDSEDALLLPRGAFHQTTAGQWVFVIDADGRNAIRRPIRLGRQNPDAFEVVAGLEEGERVIVSSYRAFAGATTLLLNHN